MYVEQLILKNFRNYNALNLELIQGDNFIIGPNGSGKTNILEAIFIVSNIKSFRGVPDSEIIKWGENTYYCKVVIAENSEKEFEIGCSIQNKLRKKVKIDGKEINRLQDYYGKLLSVVFSPSDIEIITGSPEARRKFFDGILSRIDTTYLQNLSEFKRILRSRNCLLKLMKEGKEKSDESLDTWDRMFAKSARTIIQKRREFIPDFSKFFGNAYGNIAGVDEVPLLYYECGLQGDDEEGIYNFLKGSKKRDIIMGSTCNGPQRDDFILQGKNERLYNNFASQGQKRTAAIALKIAESNYIEEIAEKKVIIMVDDIFSELDDDRKRRLSEFLSRDNQVIYTMVNESSIDISSHEKNRIYRILENGNIASQ